MIDDLPLFSVARAEPVRVSVIEQKLASVIPDDLSARDALALIYELKGMLGK